MCSTVRQIGTTDKCFESDGGKSLSRFNPEIDLHELRLVLQRHLKRIGVINTKKSSVSVIFDSDYKHKQIYFGNNCFHHDNVKEIVHMNFTDRTTKSLRLSIDSGERVCMCGPLTGIYCSIRPPGKIPCNFGPSLRSLSNVNTTVSVRTVSSACSPCVRP